MTDQGGQVGRRAAEEAVFEIVLEKFGFFLFMMGP
jgi:hypothetical protein